MICIHRPRRPFNLPYVDDSGLTLGANRLIDNWLPFDTEGNGDNLSFNLNAVGLGNLVFDDHSGSMEARMPRGTGWRRNYQGFLTVGRGWFLSTQKPWV